MTVIQNSCYIMNSNRRCTAIVLGVACLLERATGHPAPSKQEWEDAINTFINNYVEAYNKMDMDRLLALYTSDFDFLKPGDPVAVGNDELAQVLRNSTGWGKIDFWRLEEVRFYCTDGAVAENSFSMDGRLGKGVVVFEMEDGVARAVTDIYNFN